MTIETAFDKNIIKTNKILTKTNEGKEKKTKKVGKAQLFLSAVQ